jgi:6-phosphogluconolactonase
LSQPPANAPYPRITQTLARLLTARHIVLPLSGADKLQTLQRAWQQATPTLPISMVLHQTTTPVALWIAA